MEIISRIEAKKRGLIRYYTGVPCGNGHVAERYTRNYECIQCRRDSRNKKSTSSEVKHKKVSSNESLAPKYKDKPEERPINRQSSRSKNKRLKKSKPIKLENLTDIQKRINTRTRFHLGKVKARSKNGEPYHSNYELSEDVLGYTHNQLHKHLRSLRQGWGESHNQGRWHVDHIIPVSHLIRQGVEQPAVINSLENLQLLTAKQNLKKSYKIKKLTEVEIQEFISSETQKYSDRMEWARSLSTHIFELFSNNSIDLICDEKYLRYSCSWHYGNRKIIPQKPDLDFLKGYIISDGNNRTPPDLYRKRIQLLNVLAKALGEDLLESDSTDYKSDGVISPHKKNSSPLTICALIIGFIILCSWLAG